MPAEAAPAWVLIPGLRERPERFALPEDAAHYVGRVCRSRGGERVTATDGAGVSAVLEVESVGHGVDVRVLERRFHPRATTATVLCGAPDPGRVDWLIEKLAELGVARFVPLECARTTWRAVRLDRWERLAAAALTQSRSAWMLETSAPCTIPDAIAGLPSDGWRHLASETATAVEETAPVPGSSSIVAVGPAAGFSAEEIRALEDGGFEPVRLAGTRLRTETAALAWAAWWARSALAHTPGAA